ncbi:hypothetical protein PILCRDRAFT_829129 [Piloderma croceum F 1598]|uniref:Exoribonuclease Xrn1 D2/D3 domain-containing protein n=1 Tax=Piloderma croceum (strain F 1598) TaxID=765440 RepID=A0A0C3AI21_PILCF|nr:hypothetical protein PILCRDRAFT_829129 [Piloderma croceum F 1598]
MVGLSGRAVGKITSSFVVITSSGQKNNIGFSLEFEAKDLKVIDYSRKEGRNWEYSERAVELIRDYNSSFLKSSVGWMEVVTTWRGHLMCFLTPYMSGVTMGDQCSQYRRSTVESDSS